MNRKNILLLFLICGCFLSSEAGPKKIDTTVHKKEKKNEESNSEKESEYKESKYNEKFEITRTIRSRDKGFSESSEDEASQMPETNILLADTPENKLAQMHKKIKRLQIRKEKKTGDTDIVSRLKNNLLDIHKQADSEEENNSEEHLELRKEIKRKALTEDEAQNDLPCDRPSLELKTFQAAKKEGVRSYLESFFEVKKTRLKKRSEKYLKEELQYWTDAKDELITRLVHISRVANWAIRNNSYGKNLQAQRAYKDIFNLRLWLELYTLEQLTQIAYKVEKILSKDISSIYTGSISFDNIEKAREVLITIFDQTHFNVQPFFDAESHKTAGILKNGTYSAGDHLIALKEIEEQYEEQYKENVSKSISIKKKFEEELRARKATALTALTAFAGAKVIYDRYGERITGWFSSVAAEAPAIERIIQQLDSLKGQWSYRLNDTQRKIAKTVFFSSCFVGGSVLWYRSLMKTNAEKLELERELQAVKKIHESLSLKKLSPVGNASHQTKRKCTKKIFKELKAEMMPERERFMASSQPQEL